MKYILNLFALLCWTFCLRAEQTSVSVAASSQVSLKALYDSLDPLSVSQHLALYELYPNSQEGKQALSKAWQLLSTAQHLQAPPIKSISLPKFDIPAIVSLVTRQSFDPPMKLNEEQLLVIEKIGVSLCNRKLKGSSVWTKDELLSLPTDEIDLARGLLINQYEDSVNFENEILQYEASLDLMALQNLSQAKRKCLFGG